MKKNQEHTYWESRVNFGLGKKYSFGNEENQQMTKNPFPHSQGKSKVTTFACDKYVPTLTAM